MLGREIGGLKLDQSIDWIDSVTCATGQANLTGEKFLKLATGTNLEGTVSFLSRNCMQLISDRLEQSPSCIHSSNLVVARLS